MADWCFQYNVAMSVPILLHGTVKIPAAAFSKIVCISLTQLVLLSAYQTAKLL